MLKYNKLQDIIIVFQGRKMKSVYLNPLILALLLGTSVFAQHGKVVRVKEISTSKKSVIVDNGKFEGVKIGTKGKLYFVDKSLGFKKPKYIFIADGEAIKVHNNYSYWFLRNIENYSLIERDKEIVIFDISNDQRRPLKVRHTKNVGDRLYKNKRDKSVPEDLVFLEDQFKSSEKLFESYPTKAQDMEIVESTPWVGNGEEVDENFNQVKKVKYSPPRETAKKISTVKDSKNFEVFDLTTKGSTKKLSNLNSGIESLYYTQERDASESKRDSDYQSIYKQMKQAKFQKEIVSPSAIEKVRAGGPLHSSGLSDDQLRDFYIRSGIEKELRRQKSVLEEKASHEISIRYASGISDNSSAADPNHQSADYSISFGYEFHLANSLESLTDFTLEAQFERGIGHYDIGGINGRFSEASIKIHGNWYFWNAPSKLNKYLPYVGVGFKRGNADVTSFSLTNDYSYSFVSLPAYHLGLKYRFKAGDTVDDFVKIGVGLNFMITQEAIKYTAIETLNDNINSDFVNSQTKMVFGVNFYF